MLTAYFHYDDNRESAVDLATRLTSLSEEQPHATFRFCTHSQEKAIGVLVGDALTDFTPEAIQQAWHEQAETWMTDEDEDSDFDLPAWILNWTLIQTSEPVPS